MSNWIPVSKRLPKQSIRDDGQLDPSDYVLVQVKQDKMCVSCDKKISRYWERDSLHSPWMDLKGNNNVIAWMSLPESYTETKNWIVGICSSACDGVITYRVTGSEEQVKKHLLNLVNEDRDHDDEMNWEHGTETLSDITENEKGWYAYGCYSDYHIDYSAIEEKEPEVL